MATYNNTLQMTLLVVIVAVLVAVAYQYKETADRRHRATDEYRHEQSQSYIQQIQRMLLTGVSEWWAADGQARDHTFDNTWRVSGENGEYAEQRIRTSIKPILWIYVPPHSLKQPYLHLTVKSIVRHCRDSFTIVIIDDASFTTLLSGTSSINSRIIRHTCRPVQDKIRTLAIIQLLRKYGGMVVPMSFLCFHDLRPLYDAGIGSGNGMFACETRADNDGEMTSLSSSFQCSPEFMGVDAPENETMVQFEEEALRVLSSDFTEESLFLGTLNKWLDRHATHVSAYDVGTRLQAGSNVALLDSSYNQEVIPLTVEILLGTAPHIDFAPGAYGVWLPQHDIAHRTAYHWFLGVPADTLLSQGIHNIAIAKYFVVSLAD